MTNDPEKKPNVVDLAEARKRQRTLRAGASGKKEGGKPAQAKGAKKILVYLQFLVFLAIVAYMMQLCRSGT